MTLPWNQNTHKKKTLGVKIRQPASKDTLEKYAKMDGAHIKKLSIKAGFHTYPNFIKQERSAIFLFIVDHIITTVRRAWCTQQTWDDCFSTKLVLKVPSWYLSHCTAFWACSELSGRWIWASSLVWTVCAAQAVIGNRTQISKRCSKKCLGHRTIGKQPE